MGAFLLYISIPFFSAIVGWWTNQVALKMICEPIEFVGIKPPLLGWQGLIPRSAFKMATLSVDILTSKLITVEDVLNKMNATRLAAELEAVMLTMVESMANDLMMTQAPEMWASVPIKIKEDIYKRIKTDAAEVISAMMTDIKADVREFFDLEGMVIEALVRDRALLVKLFQEVGHQEFRFIETCGFCFGFLFGLVQLILWWIYPVGWTFPLAGALVGATTNWLALYLIFDPKTPVTYGPYTLFGKQIAPITVQGLLAKRHDEVASDFGLLISSELLNPENIIGALLKGPSSDKFFNLVQRHVKRTMDHYAGYSKPFIPLTLGTKRYIEIKDRAVDRIMGHIPESVPHIHAYTEEAMEIEKKVRSQLKELTPNELEAMLRPAFKEDEWQLVAVGGVLGFLVSWAQLVFLFDGSLF